MFRFIHFIINCLQMYDADTKIDADSDFTDTS